MYTTNVYRTAFIKPTKVCIALNFLLNPFPFARLRRDRSIAAPPRGVRFPWPLIIHSDLIYLCGYVSNPCNPAPHCACSPGANYPPRDFHTSPIVRLSDMYRNANKPRPFDHCSPREAIHHPAPGDYGFRPGRNGYRRRLGLKVRVAAARTKGWGGRDCGGGAAVAVAVATN